MNSKNYLQHPTVIVDKAMNPTETPTIKESQFDLTAYSNIFTEAARKAVAGLKEDEEYEE